MPRLRPDKDKYRKAWNKSWEDDLLDRYPPGQKPPNMISPIPPERIRFLKDAESLPSLQLEKDSRTKEICILQRDLAEAAVTGLSNDNLEERWRSLSQQRREELVLEGLYVTSCVPNGMETWRTWCPEMTVATLSGTNDRDFIHLLKMLLPVDRVKETLGTPLLVPNPAFEELMMTDDAMLRRMVDRYRLYRSYFITMAVWSILNAFYGNREQMQAAKPLYRDKSETTKAFLRQAKEIYKAEGKLPEFSESQKDYDRRKETENWENLCWHCNRKEADASAGGERFQICSRCKTVGRVVRYCSVECQKKDWKQGFPRPHKAICGKDVFEEDKTDESIPETKDTESETGIPPSDPCFKRSPDLLHQISFITKPTPCDYVYMRPRPFDDIGIDIPDIEDKVLFTVMRRQAMINGDPVAVLNMFAILRTYAPPSISEDQLKTQLKKEYSVDVDLLGEDFWDKTMDPPTEEEQQIIKELVRKKLMHRNVEDSYPRTDTRKELVRRKVTHQNIEDSCPPANSELRVVTDQNVEESHTLTGAIFYSPITLLTILLVPYFLSVLIR
ncbi:uncharacterized protein EV420DRAFT_589446 [Desarmillaria tabescens]|uniref:MYND-type domain-containing protein n=1 Tax=Armillaria tabescens TaxID=1929756 RepID=A0AA39K883_ARMTA|nr:uncharacterized protein EV420DRAFT_589446 [Desarmillaria tabescens]KAK0455235.1 hypothetical protein EV420DRAFT_589446 [Desarmillaria tabescens]